VAAIAKGQGPQAFSNKGLPIAVSAFPTKRPLSVKALIFPSPKIPHSKALLNWPKAAGPARPKGEFNGPPAINRCNSFPLGS